MNEIEGMNDYLCPRAQPQNMPSISFMNPVHTSLMIDHPLYAIILQIHTSNLPKYTKKKIISTASSPVSCSTKVTVKSMTWLECTIQNRGLRCACAYTWAHNNEYLRCICNFWRENILKHHFIFTIKYTELKMIRFERVRLSFIKNSPTYFWKCDQISIISQS